MSSTSRILELTGENSLAELARFKLILGRERGDFLRLLDLRTLTSCGIFGGFLLTDFVVLWSYGSQIKSFLEDWSFVDFDLFTD